MNFGLMMIWNWVAGLVLLFPVCAIMYFICLKKFGKDVMDRFDGEGEFDVQCLFYAAIVAFLWEAALPIVCYLMFQMVKGTSEIMQK